VWVTPAETEGWFIFSYILGVSVTIFNSYFNIVLGNYATARLILDSHQSKTKGETFRNGYYSAIAVSTGLISTMLLILVILIPIEKCK
jgi:hypothetical protein